MVQMELSVEDKGWRLELGPRDLPLMTNIESYSNDAFPVASAGFSTGGTCSAGSYWDLRDANLPLHRPLVNGYDREGRALDSECVS